MVEDFRCRAIRYSPSSHPTNSFPKSLTTPSTPSLPSPAFCYKPPYRLTLLACTPSPSFPFTRMQCIFCTTSNRLPPSLSVTHRSSFSSSIPLVSVQQHPRPPCLVALLQWPWQQPLRAMGNKHGPRVFQDAHLQGLGQGENERQGRRICKGNSEGGGGEEADGLHQELIRRRVLQSFTNLLWHPRVTGRQCERILSFSVLLLFCTGTRLFWWHHLAVTP